MGWFRRIVLGKTDLTDGMLRSFERNATLATAATDDDLWKLAQERKGHISDKAVSDEYDRLILEKHGRR